MRTKLWRSAPNIQHPGRVFIVCTVFIAAVSLLLLHLDNSHKQWLQKTETSLTQATITSVDPSFHNTAYFNYAVASKIYQSAAQGWAENVGPGESVTIHYNPNDPVEATLGDFEPLTPLSIVWGVVLITIFVFWSYYLLFLRQKRR